MTQRHPFRSLEANKKYGSEYHLWDRILLESRHFISLPSLGQLVPGWLLVAPKDMYLCVGAIPTGMFEELASFIDRVASLVRSEYGQVAIFEHGPVQTQTSVGCGVDHAHIHIVPVKSNWSLLQNAKTWAPEISWNYASSIEETQKYFNTNKPYLYLLEPASDSPVIGTCTSIPSQLFRRIIASNIGRPRDYDWKNYPEFENIHATVAKIQKSLASIL